VHIPWKTLALSAPRFRSDQIRARRPSPGRDGERGVQPVGSAAEGGVPRRDGG
jgi:hypothetical protein